jgi:hypothetical protein
MRDLLFWKKAKIRRIVEMGQADAKTISIPDCFSSQ